MPAHSPPRRALLQPAVQQIKALIVDSLQHGEWSPGEAIPSEIDWRRATR
jgi:GntR family transcriptional regulator